MKTNTQTHLCKKAGISNSYLSLIVNGFRRPTWTMAKRLAAATGKDERFWLEAEPAKIREFIYGKNGS